MAQTDSPRGRQLRRAMTITVRIVRILMSSLYSDLRRSLSCATCPGLARACPNHGAGGARSGAHRVAGRVRSSASTRPSPCLA
jgi:hypothetical protein